MATPDPAAPRVTVVRFEPTARGLLIVAVAGAVLWATIRLLPVIFVVVVALFLVGTLGPAVDFLQKKGMLKRGTGIALSFGLLFVSAVLIMALTVPSLVEQVVTMAKQEPEARRRVADTLAQRPLTAPLAEALRNFHYEAVPLFSTGAALDYTKRAVEVAAYLVSAVFLAMYVMIDRDRLRGALFALVPRTHHVRMSRVLLNLETIVGGYIRGQALTSVMMGIFTFALLTACGVSNALAIAVFAGLADVLPYIGVFLSVGPALAASLSRGPTIAVIVLVSMLAYEELESRFLVPRIYGQVLRLPSSVVLLSLLVGGTLMGVVGALLALPVAAAARMLIEELRIELPGEELDDADLRARDERAEQEYERRAEGVPATEAAAIAVELAETRRQEEGGAAEATKVPVTGGERERA